MRQPSGSILGIRSSTGTGRGLLRGASRRHHELGTEMPWERWRRCDIKATLCKLHGFHTPDWLVRHRLSRVTAGTLPLRRGPLMRYLALIGALLLGSCVTDNQGYVRVHGRTNPD